VTRVFLVAALQRERDRVHDLLDAAGAQVIGSAAELAGLDEEVLEAADVLLLDASREPLEELLQELQERGLLRETRVVVLAGANTASTWTNQALRGGLRGILPLDASAAQLAAALNAVAQEWVVLPPNARALRANASNELDGLDAIEPLTAREREVLQMLARGRGNKEIAASLKISEHTAKFHVASILGKLGASTRTEAVSLALQRGLILL
jgi:DNA-binding NarL/FixJ family response regulator